MRHWLLNYFADDFAPSASLRSQFVHRINSFGRDPRVRQSPRDARIVLQLKRCWRRVCTIYWDTRKHEQNSESKPTDTDMNNNRPWQVESKNPATNRVPSLILRATKEREEKRYGVGTSRSQPDLRKCSANAESAVCNSTYHRRSRVHVHSTSSIKYDRKPRSGHRRNLSEEVPILYSKNSNPALFQSFARGFGLSSSELPPSLPDLPLLSSNITSSTKVPVKPKSRNVSKRGKEKSQTPGFSLRCLGTLSDDEPAFVGEKRIRPTSTENAIVERVDFLVAGMGRYVVALADQEPSIDFPKAEQIGEALIQKYLHPHQLDERDLPEDSRHVKAQLAQNTMDIEVGNTPGSLSVSVVDRKLKPSPRGATLSSRTVLSAPLANQERFIDQSLTTPSKLLLERPSTPPLRNTLRRRPGGNLRQMRTGGLRRRSSLGSMASSLSGISLGIAEDALMIPSMSTEARSLESLFDITQKGSTRYSPTHRKSGLAIDFSGFSLPPDVVSSDDEDCDPSKAVEKTLLKLEGKYVRKGSRPRPRLSKCESPVLSCKSVQYNRCSEGLEGDTSGFSASPPQSIMIERSASSPGVTHDKHHEDGHKCTTRTCHGPFTPSSLFLFTSPGCPSSMGTNFSHPNDIEAESGCYPWPTVESTLAELERDQIEIQQHRIQPTASPNVTTNFHRSLTSHLPFILQCAPEVLAEQFTLIEKDICAEIDWFELMETTWVHQTFDTNIRDWKQYVREPKSQPGLRTAVARFNLVLRPCALLI